MTLLKLIGGLIFLLFLFFVFWASKSHQEQQLRLTQLINQMMIENAKINSTKPMVEVISVEPVPMENTLPTRAVPSSVPMRAPTYWRSYSGKDVGGSNTFHYHKSTNPKASLKTCLKQCEEQSNCKGVVFGKVKSFGKETDLCWGKTEVTKHYSHGLFSLYEKTIEEHGLLEPWNTPPVSEVVKAPVSEVVKAPVSEVVKGITVSTNGRCGQPTATRCPGKQCCSNSGWCAGTQGTKSAWCSKDGKGQSLGKYDGRS
tara:strand:+ start:389 stop:1159 length:771 start_codon:yes stop_codon:yes gene_type:complete